MIKTIPGYGNYGLDDSGRVLSKAKGGWKELKQDRYSFRLCQDGKQISVSRQKFVFCALNQVSPHFKDTNILVSKDGLLITRKERRAAAQKTLEEKNASPRLVEKQIRMLEKEANLNRCAVEYLKNDDSTHLYMEILKDKDDYLNLLQMKNRTAPKDCIEYNFDRACENLLIQLKRGRVFSLVGHIIKSADGNIKNEMKRFCRIKDLQL